MKSLQKEAVVDPLILCGSAAATLRGTAMEVTVLGEAVTAPAEVDGGGEVAIGFSWTASAAILSTSSKSSRHFISILPMAEP